MYSENGLKSRSDTFCGLNGILQDIHLSVGSFFRRRRTAFGSDLGIDEVNSLRMVDFQSGFG